MLLQVRPHRFSSMQIWHMWKPQVRQVQQKMTRRLQKGQVVSFRSLRRRRAGRLAFRSTEVF
jgi:hypothetical protein